MARPLTVQTLGGAANVVPIFQVRVPLEEAIHLPDVFAELGVDLLAVDIDTAQPMRDANGNAVRWIRQYQLGVADAPQF